MSPKEAERTWHAIRAYVLEKLEASPEYGESVKMMSERFRTEIPAVIIMMGLDNENPKPFGYRVADGFAEPMLVFWRIK